MHLSVVGTKSKSLIAELTEAANFFARQLMDPRMVQNLTVKINVVSNLEDDGECLCIDNGRSPRTFAINLKRKPVDDDIITILAHEMVHVKQYAKNELDCLQSISFRGKVTYQEIWLGEIWKPKRKQDEYFDSPWEQQAFGMQVGLTHKWYTRNDPNVPWNLNQK